MNILNEFYCSNGYLLIVNDQYQQATLYIACVIHCDGCVSMYLDCVMCCDSNRTIEGLVSDGVNNIKCTIENDNILCG